LRLNNRISAIIILFRAKITETTERRPPRTNSPTIAAKDQQLQAKGQQLMTKLGYQPKILLPEGEFFRFEILSADIEDGEYGYQLEAEAVYGGVDYIAVDVRLADGQYRLFWPRDLEEIPSPPRDWWRLLLGETAGS
jgi:hypothetical protein